MAATPGAEAWPVGADAIAFRMNKVGLGLQFLGIHSAAHYISLSDGEELAT